MKKWHQSKRFWTGVIFIITSISLIITGEKTWQEVIPELVLSVIGLAQFIIAVASGEPIDFGGGKTLLQKFGRK